jgi:hypothetical protein
MDHHCYNGMVFADGSKRRMVPCPICQKERKTDVRDGVKDEETGKVISLAEKLGLSKRFVSDVYSDEYIIGKTDLYYLEKESVKEFNETVDKLISNLVMGRLPSTSLVMYLGRHAKLQEFAYILLASAYKGVLSIGKILTPREIRLNKYSEDFKEHYTNDLEVIIATSDIDNIGFDEIQGFMQERAYKNKPTIVLLSHRKNFTYTLGKLCSLDSERYDLGAYIGVNYKRNLNMSEESILIARKAYEVSNKSLGTNQELEDYYKIPANNKTNINEHEMQSFDINEYAGHGTFDGRI